jgi:biopolymer transport protein ExbD
MMRADNRVQAAINVTPFLDILLVLLVVFLASIQARRTLDVQLPLPSSDACTMNCEAIVLEVLPRGTLALNQARFSLSELARRVHAAFDGRPNSVLFVKGGEGVQYQDVITVMDIARGAGVKVLAIAPKALR